MQVLDAHFLLTGKEPMLPKLRAFAEGLMSSPIPDELNAMTDIVSELFIYQNSNPRISSNLRHAVID